MWVKQLRLILIKKLVEKAAKKLSAPKSQVANVMVPQQEITKKVNEVITKYVDTSAINLNKLIDGSIVNRPTASNAIAIQDHVKRFTIANESNKTVRCFAVIYVSSH